MRKDDILFLANELDIPLNEWTELNELERIILCDGRGVYPSWKYLRFLISKDGDIFIRHGHSEPYGARLTLNFAISIDGLGVQLDPNNLVPGTEFYEHFRLPEIGDTIRLTNGITTISESLITNVIRASNCFSISVFPALNTNTNGRLSFYSKSLQKPLAMHSAPVEGVYMNFIENPGRSHKQYGTYHEILKPKDITEIVLRVKSKYNEKTFRIGGEFYGRVRQNNKD